MLQVRQQSYKKIESKKKKKKENRVQHLRIHVGRAGANLQA